MENDIQNLKADTNSQDDVSNLEKLTQSYLLLKEKICRTHDLIKKYNDKLKECERLSSDLDTMSKQAKKMTCNFNSTLAKVIKLELQNTEYKKNIESLTAKVNEQEIKMAADQQHIQQLVCKIKATEEQHSEKVMECDLEKSSFQVKIKELENELKSTQKSYETKIKKMEKKISSESINPINVKPHKPPEEKKSTRDAAVNTCKIPTRKIEHAEKYTMTNESYSIKDDIYPVFCAKCEILLEPPPLEKICKMMSTGCPRLIEKICSPVKELPSQIQISSDVTNECCKVENIIKMPEASSSPGVQNESNHNEFTPPSHIRSRTPVLINQSGFCNNLSQLSPSISNLINQAGYYTGSETMTVLPLSTSNATHSNNQCVDIATMATSLSVIESLQKRINMLEGKFKKYLKKKNSMDNSNYCQQNRSSSCCMYGMNGAMQSNLTFELLKKMMDLYDTKEQKSFGTYNENASERVKKSKLKKVKLKQVKRLRNASIGNWKIESVPKRTEQNQRRKKMKKNKHKNMMSLSKCNSSLNNADDSEKNATDSDPDPYDYLFNNSASRDSIPMSLEKESEYKSEPCTDISCSTLESNETENVLNTVTVKLTNIGAPIEALRNSIDSSKSIGAETDSGVSSDSVESSKITHSVPIANVHCNLPKNDTVEELEANITKTVCPTERIKLVESSDHNEETESDQLIADVVELNEKNAQVGPKQLMTDLMEPTEKVKRVECEHLIVNLTESNKLSDKDEPDQLAVEQSKKAEQVESEQLIADLAEPDDKMEQSESEQLVTDFIEPNERTEQLESEQIMADITEPDEVIQKEISEELSNSNAHKESLSIDINSKKSPDMKNDSKFMVMDRRVRDTVSNETMNAINSPRLPVNAITEQRKCGGRQVLLKKLRNLKRNHAGVNVQNRICHSSNTVNHMVNHHTSVIEEEKCLGNVEDVKVDSDLIEDYVPKKKLRIAHARKNTLPEQNISVNDNLLSKKRPTKNVTNVQTTHEKSSDTNPVEDIRAKKLQEVKQESSTSTVQSLNVQKHATEDLPKFSNGISSMDIDLNNTSGNVIKKDTDNIDTPYSYDREIKQNSGQRSSSLSASSTMSQSIESLTNGCTNSNRLTCQSPFSNTSESNMKDHDIEIDSPCKSASESSHVNVNEESDAVSSDDDFDVSSEIAETITEPEKMPISTTSTELLLKTEGIFLNVSRNNLMLDKNTNPPEYTTYSVKAEDNTREAATVNNSINDKVEAIDTPFSRLTQYINQGKVLTKSSKKQRKHLQHVRLLTDKFVKKQLQRLMDSGWQTSIHCDVVEKLRTTCSPRIIAKGILDFLSLDQKCNKGLDKTYTPPAPLMTKAQQRMAALLVDLKESEPLIIDLVQAGIEYNLFRLGKTLDTKVLESLTRMYVVLARIQKDRERIRIFCCDALYCFGLQAIFVLYTVLTCWPEVFPRCENNKEILPKCIAHLIGAQQATDVSKLSALKNLMTVFYQYKLGGVTKDLLNELLSELEEKPSNQLDTAIILLAKREGTSWTYKNIVREHLLPMIITNRHPCMYRAFCLLGNMMRAFPTEDKDNSVSTIVEQLSDLINSGEGSEDQREGIISALLSLSRHKFDDVAQSVIKWNPTKPLYPRTIEQLDGFLRMRNPDTWKAYLKKNKYDTPQVFMKTKT